MHDITATRYDHIVAHLREAGLGALGDLGFVGINNDDEGEHVIVHG